MDFNVILFDDFEVLDVFGPVEVMRKLPKHYAIKYYSQNGGLVTSKQDTRIDTLPFSRISHGGVLLIPGGMGTRTLVNDARFINEIRSIAEDSEYVLTVCTGSALLAKTGLPDNRNATTNKMAFNWVESNGANVKWDRDARWVVDGKYYTSAGVSAGLDMSLGFVADIHGLDVAMKITDYIEYDWNKNKRDDKFSHLAKSL